MLPQYKKYPYSKIFVETLNQKGTISFEEYLTAFANSDTEKPKYKDTDNDSDFLFILFSKNEEMDHFSYICYIIKTFQEKLKISELKRNKKIVLIIRQKLIQNKNIFKAMSSWDINLVSDKLKWKFFVIENLKNSFYK